MVRVPCNPQHHIPWRALLKYQFFGDGKVELAGKWLVHDVDAIGCYSTESLHPSSFSFITLLLAKVIINWSFDKAEDIDEQSIYLSWIVFGA